MRNLLSSAIIVVLTLCLATAATGQERQKADSNAMPLGGRIKVNDVIDVTVLGIGNRSHEVRKRVRVMADGTASVYYIPPVKLVGLTGPEAGRAVKQAYHDTDAKFAIEWADVQRVEDGDHPSVPGEVFAPEDLVRVVIEGLRGVDTTSDHCVRVERDGQIVLPYLAAMTVASLNEQQLEVAIIKSYRAAHLFQNAAVAVLRLNDSNSTHVNAGPIGPGDLLHVVTDYRFIPNKEFDVDVRVGEDGRIGLPGLQHVKVAGLTPAQATLALGKAMAGEGSPTRNEVWVFKAESADHAGILVGPVRSGDCLSVLIIGAPAEFPPACRRVVRVDNDGAIRLPYLEQVKLAGLSETAAQQAIEKAYEDAEHKGVGVSTLRLPVGGASSTTRP